MAITLADVARIIEHEYDRVCVAGGGHYHELTVLEKMLGFTGLLPYCRNCGRPRRNADG